MTAYYENNYRSIEWCGADPALGLDAEPEACGPSIGTLIRDRERTDPAGEGHFDPRWSPKFFIRHRNWPLDFNR